MRFPKLLFPTVLAAMAVIAFVPASASASELCSTNTAPCTGTMYAPGTEIHAVLGSGTTLTFTSSLVNVHCTSSTLVGETTTTGKTGFPVVGKFTAWTFSGCKTTSGSNCTVTARGVNGMETPQATITAAGGGNGVIAIAPAMGSMNPGAHVTCGFFLNCTYSSPGFEFDLDGGNPALITAITETLEGEGGICPEEASLDATYEVTTPKPLFVVHP